MTKINSILKGKTNMKKILALIMAGLLAATLISCTQDEKNDDVTNDNKNDKNEAVETVKVSDAYELVESLYASVPEENKPMLMTEILNADNFEWLSFIPYEEGLEGVVSQPMMGSIAHKVVIIKAKDNADAARVAELLKENADPRWLICVEADDIRTATNENLAMLLLTNTELGMGDEIMDAFARLDKEAVANLPKFEAPVFEDEFVEDEFVGNEADTEADEDVVIDFDENEDLAVSVTENEDAVEIEISDLQGDEQIHLPMQGAEVIEPEAPSADSTDVYTVFDSFYSEIPEDNKPFLMTQVVDADTFEWLTFIPYEEGLEAAVNQPMMGSIAHRVVLVKCKDNADAVRVADLLKTNANPRWLICVEADDVRTATNGKYAMLMLTNSELGMGDIIYNAFTSLDANADISFAA